MREHRICYSRSYLDSYDACHNTCHRIWLHGCQMDVMNPDSLHSSILRIHDDSWFLNAICPAMMRSMWEGFGHSLWRCYLQPWTSLKDISWGFRTLGFAFPQFWEYVWSPSEHVRNCLWKIGWKNATGAMTPATSIMCTASAPRYRPVIRPGLLRWHGTLQWSCHWDPLRIIIYIYIYIYIYICFRSVPN